MIEKKARSLLAESKDGSYIFNHKLCSDTHTSCWKSKWLGKTQFANFACVCMTNDQYIVRRARCNICTHLFVAVDDFMTHGKEIYDSIDFMKIFQMNSIVEIRIALRS